MSDTPNADELEAELLRRAGIAERLLAMDPVAILMVAADIQLHTTHVPDLDQGSRRWGLDAATDLVAVAMRRLDESRDAQLQVPAFVLLYANLHDQAHRHHSAVARANDVSLADALVAAVAALVHEPDTYFEVLASRHPHRDR